VSPLWRDEIGIYVSPHKLALTRLARGVRPKSTGAANWSNELLQDTHWSASLAALDATLAKPEWQGAVARLVVSDHWVRYAMVPYSAALNSAAERLAHARHVLTDIYGEIVADWTVSLGKARPGAAHVVCAVPAALLDELHAILMRHKIPLRSLQPQLVCAYNHWRAQLPNSGAWFVSIEQGSLAAARLGLAGWDRVHNVRIGADWTVELHRLRTFGRLASAQAQEGRVYVDAPAALRIAAGTSGPDLVWLEESQAGESTTSRLEFMRRHQA
jgi:hypothetical protein